MLNNLKLIYLRDADLSKALAGSAAAGDSRSGRRRRYPRPWLLSYLQLECLRQALEDLERYLEVNRRTPIDAAMVRERINYRR